MSVTITPRAEKFMARMIRFNGGAEGSGFRLVVTPGGCSGLSSSFTVENAPLAGDETVVSNGINVFLPAESRILLDGVTVDFSDSVMESGLTFINPNAASCGCSSSGSSHGHDHGMPPGQASVSIASIQRKH
jgi:iron-sulfur cluster assembly protein